MRIVDWLYRLYLASRARADLEGLHLRVRQSRRSRFSRMADSSRESRSVHFGGKRDRCALRNSRHQRESEGKNRLGGIRSSRSRRRLRVGAPYLRGPNSKVHILHYSSSSSLTTSTTCPRIANICFGAPARSKLTRVGDRCQVGKAHAESGGASSPSSASAFLNTGLRRLSCVTIA